MEALSYCQLMERMLAAEARVAELESGKVGNALLERENHHVEVVGKLTERIAELESRTVAVRLPSGTGWASDPYNHGCNDGISECTKELRAAGINVEAE